MDLGGHDFTYCCCLGTIKLTANVAVGLANICGLVGSNCMTDLGGSGFKA